jgi:hypothetical protein
MKIKEVLTSKYIVYGIIIAFSLVYVISGYIWLRAPDEKFEFYQISDQIRIIVFVLGCASIFLKLSPLILYPILALFCGIAGYVVYKILVMKLKYKLIRPLLIIGLFVIDYYAGAILCMMGIMEW